MKCFVGCKIRQILFVLVLALSLIASVANADFTFGTPTNLGPTVNSSAWDRSTDVSADGLELYFTSDRPDGYGSHDIWVTTRATKDDSWSTPVNLGPTVNSSSGDTCLSISADGLELYFDSERPGGYGGADLWVTTRATTDDEWATPVNLGLTVNSSADDWAPSISSDGLSLYFTSSRPGGYGGGDLWVTTRETSDDDWGPPVNLGPTVNSSVRERGPSISADGLLLYFDSTRAGGYGNCDIWVSRRATTSDSWGVAVNVGPTVNSSNCEHFPSLSTDGSTLFFQSNRPGGFGDWDIWQVPVIPIVDFNSDEIVDIKDLVRLIEFWGTNEPLCDIGPMPWGDGIVDVQDLEVLMSYWQQEVPSIWLLAHWKLDETEGDIAHDSVADKDGTLYGNPIWQPTGGMVAGALQFDGIDDYVSTPFVLNPTDGAFSVFAWVKGGAPGQVVLSQTGGVDWLSADPSEGYLMTELRFIGGRFAQPTLLSQALITDGVWHRVGFVWDGSNRILYVDDVEAAKDTQTGLAGSTGGLHIGAGKGLEPGSFWSGLIDDVRIYNRAMSP